VRDVDVGECPPGFLASRPGAGVSGPQADFRRSETGRKQSWHGLKRYVKGVLGMRVPHWLMRRALVLKPDLRRSGRLPAPRHLKEVEGRAGRVTFVMLRPERCVIAKELYWGKGLRPRAEDALAIELFASLAADADIVVDVGAYTGIFSLVSAKVNPDVHVHAFEIVPAVHEMLRENAVRNGVADRVTPHLAGVGRPGGSITVPEGSGGSALPDFYSTKLHFDEGRKVDLVALDSLVEAIPTGSRVLMKIDVEGSEDEVLEFGQGLLGSFGPDILCEILDGVADAASVERSLSPHGYRYFLVREHDLEERPGIVPDPRFRDWLFTRRASPEWPFPVKAARVHDQV
jgi:FkbM family methyltransferase